MNRSLRRLAVRGFYALINWGARQKIPEDAGDFRLLSPRAATALRQLAGAQPLLQGPRRTGSASSQIRVDYEPAPRAHGVTTFNAGRLIGLSIEGLTSFSVAPLRFASLLGVLLAGAAFLFGLSILWEVWTTGKQVPGYPSLMIGLMTIGGVQLIMIGIVGEYIGKILSELKARPIYFVAEHTEKRADGGTARDALRADRRRMSERRAAPDLAVRRRLRAERRRQPRDSRSDRARPPQRHLGDDGGAGDRPRRRSAALQASVAKSPRCAIGLHATLTAPFRPLTDALPPARRRLVPAVSEAVARRACCGGSIAELVRMPRCWPSSPRSASLFGRAPDFVDGHQHAQLFPQVRDGFLRAVKERAPTPGCARADATAAAGAASLARPRRWCSTCSARSSGRARARAGLRFNPAFAGAYDFSRSSPISRADAGSSLRACRRTAS